VSAASRSTIDLLVHERRGHLAVVVMVAEDREDAVRRSKTARSSATGPTYARSPRVT
jgi:hypothetical protein